MSEEKAPYDVGEARRAIAQAEAADTRACAEEVAAVLNKWSRDISAVAEITPDGRIIAKAIFVVVNKT